MTFAKTPIGTVRNSRTDIAMTDHWRTEISRRLLADAPDEHAASFGTSMQILTGSDADADRPRHRGEDWALGGPA